MSMSEKIMNELETLNDEQKREVLDFMRSLREDEEKALDALMDEIIDENLEALEELAK